MALTSSDVKKKIESAAIYLKDKAGEMERSSSGNIGTCCSAARSRLDQLANEFKQFEKDLKARE